MEKWGRERKKESCITRGGKGREGGREREKEQGGKEDASVGML